MCPGPVCPPRLSGERLGCSHLLPACPPPLGRRGRMLGLGRALAPRVGTVPAAPQGSGQTGTSHCLSWVRAPGHHPASPAHSSLSFSLCGTGFGHGWPPSSPCWQARGSPQGRLPGALSTHPLVDRVVPAGQLVPLGARLGQQVLQPGQLILQERVFLRPGARGSQGLPQPCRCSSRVSPWPSSPQSGSLSTWPRGPWCKEAAPPLLWVGTCPLTSLPSVAQTSTAEGLWGRPGHWAPLPPLGLRTADSGLQGPGSAALSTQGLSCSLTYPARPLAPLRGWRGPHYQKGSLRPMHEGSGAWPGARLVATVTNSERASSGAGGQGRSSGGPPLCTCAFRAPAFRILTHPVRNETGSRKSCKQKCTLGGDGLRGSGVSTLCRSAFSSVGDSVGGWGSHPGTGR